MIAAANGVCGAAAAADKDDDSQMNGHASYQDASINRLFQGAGLESGTTAAALRKKSDAAAAGCTGKEEEIIGLLPLGKLEGMMGIRERESHENGWPWDILDKVNKKKAISHFQFFCGLFFGMLFICSIISFL